MTVPDLAATVAAVIEFEADSPVTIVGNSMGASLATQLAADRPDLVDLLVVVGAFVADEPVRREWLHVRSQAFLNPYGGLRPVDAAFVETIFGVYEPDWHRMMLEDHIDTHPVLGSTMWALYSFDMAAVLRRILQPTLSLFGQNDQLLATSAATIRQCVKDLTEDVIPRGSHLTTIDQAGPLADRITDWLESR